MVAPTPHSAGTTKTGGQDSRFFQSKRAPIYLLQDVLTAAGQSCLQPLQPEGLSAGLGQPLW